MPEDRPTISSSRLSASDVARHNFGNVRRGFDPHEVRAFLESVSRELQLWEQREHELRLEVAEAEERAKHPVLEESMISAALGQQSANVLRSAHEEAARIVAAAEEAAATLAHRAQRQATEVEVGAEAAAAERIAEAELATGSIRQEIDRVAAAMMDKARAESEEVLARAREQGRALVERAQLARRQVLADLVHRRHELHIQIEQFRAARDELAAAVFGVRGSVDRIVADLGRVDEDARAAAAEVARRPPPDEGALTVDELDRMDLLGEEREGAGEAEAAGAREAEEGAAAGAGAPAEGETAPEAADEEATAAAAATTDLRESSLSAAEAMSGSEPIADLASAEARETASVEDIFARIRAGHDGGATSPAPEPGEGGAGAEPTPEGAAASGAETPAETPAGARETRRAGNEWVGAAGSGRPGERSGGSGAAGGPAGGSEEPSADAGADAGAAATGEDGAGEDGAGEDGVEEDGAEEDGAEEDGAGDLDPDEALLRQRADLLDPVTVRLTRRLKRALQDDQNRLLAKIRSGSGRWSDDVLVPEEEQRAALVEAAGRLLKEAYAAGAAFAHERLEPGGRSPRPGRAADKQATADAQGRAEELSGTVVGQLRRRLSEGGVDTPDGATGDDAADRVGAAYREWRGERMERLVGDAAVGAFSAGVLSAAGPGGSLRWLTANGEAACPDCDDNSLAGAVTAGGEFPTGHLHPPAHPGCRCLVAPTPA